MFTAGPRVPPSSLAALCVFAPGSPWGPALSDGWALTTGAASPPPPICMLLLPSVVLLPAVPPSRSRGDPSLCRTHRGRSRSVWSHSLSAGWGRGVVCPGAGDTNGPGSVRAHRVTATSGALGSVPGAHRVQRVVSVAAVRGPLGTCLPRLGQWPCSLCSRLPRGIRASCPVGQSWQPRPAQQLSPGWPALLCHRVCRGPWERPCLLEGSPPFTAFPWFVGIWGQGPGGPGAGVRDRPRWPEPPALPMPLGAHGGLLNVARVESPWLCGSHDFLQQLLVVVVASGAGPPATCGAQA